MFFGVLIWWKLCVWYTSADEALDDEEKNESLEQGDKYEALEEDEDDDDDEEEVEEYDYPAVVSTEEVRRCNRNNGRGWFCSELAEPGYATCLPHIRGRHDNYQRNQFRKLQGSTSWSEATFEHKVEDAATSAVGDQEEAAGPSSPDTLPHDNWSKAGDPAGLDDEAT